ncbi:MAG: dodecin family protein [Desulfohalobiaceae bacterium]|nr:dodecin family protein [Desulfohalobiaceae bacterium]
MAVVKVIEIMAQSSKGWEDAVSEAIAEASKTVNNIKSVYVKEFQAEVENNKVTSYRVNCKISFLIER